MTNELGLELDKQAQYDVTKDHALRSLQFIYCELWHFLHSNMSREEFDNNFSHDFETICKYIKERP